MCFYLRRESIQFSVMQSGLLHFMGSAFAIEKMSNFSGAFPLTQMRLIAAVGVGAGLIATGNLDFGSSDRRLLIFCHFQDFLGSVRFNRRA